MLRDFVFCIAGGKSPHQTEPSQHLYKHSALGLQKAKATLLPLLLQFSSFILPFFLFFSLSSFLQAQPPADWCNSLSFIFYFIISFCDFTSPAAAGVFLSQPILLNMRWSKSSSTTSPLIFPPFHPLPHFHVSEMVHENLLNTATISGMAEVSF